MKSFILGLLFLLLSVGVVYAGHHDEHECHHDCNPSPSPVASESPVPSPSPSLEPSIEPSPSPTVNPDYHPDAPLAPEHDNRSDGLSSDPGATRPVPYSELHPEMGEPSKASK